MKKHKHKGKGKHRNAGPPRPTVSRPTARKAPDPPGMGIGEIGAVIAASAVTAGLGSYTHRTSRTAGNVVTAVLGGGAAISAYKSDGVMRAVSAGVLAACASHATNQLLPLPKPRNDDGRYKDLGDDVTPAERRQAALPPPPEPDLAPSLRDELARAHAAVAALYPDGDYDAHRFAA